jgi:hypothetical protein
VLRYGNEDNIQERSVGYTGSADRRSDGLFSQGQKVVSSTVQDLSL